MVVVVVVKDGRGHVDECVCVCLSFDILRPVQIGARALRLAVSFHHPSRVSAGVELLE